MARRLGAWGEDWMQVMPASQLRGRAKSDGIKKKGGGGESERLSAIASGESKAGRPSEGGEDKGERGDRSETYVFLLTHTGSSQSPLTSHPLSLQSSPPE
jgi:hypothetical protein